MPQTAYGHFVHEVEENPPHPYSIVIPNNLILGMEQVYWNGIILSGGSNAVDEDYTIVNNTITFSYEIRVQESDHISIRYVYNLEEEKKEETTSDIDYIAEIWEDLLVDYSILEKDKYQMSRVLNTVAFDLIGSDFTIEVDKTHIFVSSGVKSYSTSYINPFNKDIDFIRYENHHIYIQWIKFHLNKLKEIG